MDRYVTGAFEADVKNTVGSAFAAKRVRCESTTDSVVKVPCGCH